MEMPVTEKWGVSACLEPLTGGRRNRVFHAKSVVFKSTRRSPEAIIWLAKVHNCARGAQLLVPELLQSEDGNLIENGWTCEPFFEGEHPSEDELVHLRPQIVEFHAATTNIPQRPGFRSSVELLHLSSGGDVNLNAMPVALVEKCRDAWSAVSDRQTTIVHGDLNPANIIKTRNGGFVMVDWDESRRDLALFDLGQLSEDDESGRRARLAWEVACSWVLEPEHAQKLACRL